MEIKIVMIAGMFHTVVRGTLPPRYTVHSSSSSIDLDSSSSSSDTVEVLVLTHAVGNGSFDRHTMPGTTSPQHDGSTLEFRPNGILVRFYPSRLDSIPPH